MHGCVPWQTLKTLAHIDQFLHLGITLIQSPQLRIHLQCLINGDIQLLRDHLGKTVYIIIRKIHHSSHITDHTLCRQCTEGYDLDHLFLAIFAADIVNNLLSSFEAEININIGHGHTLRVQEAFKQQIILDRVNIRDLQRIGNNTSRRRTTPRSHHDLIGLGIIDKIPHDQEIIHVPHSLDNRKLIIKAFS